MQEYPGVFTHKMMGIALLLQYRNAVVTNTDFWEQLMVPLHNGVDGSKMGWCGSRLRVFKGFVGRWV